ncbi:MAG: gliding motility-associated C-terminal domain-containing protein [Bacteroidota bacterium]
MVVSCENEMGSASDEEIAYINDSTQNLSSDDIYYISIIYHGLNDSLELIIPELSCNTLSEEFIISIIPQNKPASSYHYEWSHTDTSASQLKVMKGYNYSVTVSDDSNNYAIISLFYRTSYKYKCFFSIPTAFSPNGDGINDVWDIQGIDELYPSNKIDVFTENGVNVFTSKGYDKPWDGTYKGKKLPAGEYHFKIYLRPEMFLTGPLTIIY